MTTTDINSTSKENDMENFGDKLFKRVGIARNILFMQGEMAQLTYQSYDKFVHFINESKDEAIQVTYPIGFRPDKTALNTTNTYTKEDLVSRYEYLGYTQLPLNGIYQLVTVVEALLGDILRETLKEFPAKISNKRKLDFELVLEAKSLEEIKNGLINSILNEMAYKSPKDFADEFSKYIGINLLEKPVFHRYIELKATRDIYIHNSGMANEIYIGKAATLARVKAGEFLPVTVQYFLESYECCLQITEILEEGLNKIWPSIEYKKSKTKMTHEQQKELAVENAIEAAEKNSAEVAEKKKPIVMKAPKIRRRIGEAKKPDINKQ